ncbi:MAG TPA: 2-oxoglutarate dehydrogenase E1 component [Opitutaceae bacterium]|nr:2-oxoglutarate dehydrogenase E1 component [Opitutaceae bacterium]
MIAATLPTRANADLIEDFYLRWMNNPESVDPTWRAFFQGFTLGLSGQLPVLAGSASAAPALLDSLKQSQVHSLIYHYRAIGHRQAHLDPLADPPPPHLHLTLPDYGLADADLETFFDVGHYLDGGQMRLADIIASLRQTYCGHIGVEYLHIQDTEVRRWLQARMEPRRNQPNFTREQKIRILRRLHKAELFEHFLHTKYAGQKRFSLEGGETLIPALDTIIERCPEAGVDEIVMGMAHRGRLNVLASILRKSFEFIFEEFAESFIPDTVAGDGDVKYHLGYEAVLDTTSGDKVEVRLAANPSHLEAVDPVVEGKARARQRIRGDTERRRVLPLLLHGDAAFAGQGIVAEVLNYSQLPGYHTGGTLHLVVNNQIGFTTSPAEARSSHYCTDIAKMIDAPIFHVNGDDPEAACYVAELALDFRQQFQRDVVIDLVCYRRHGHNESDEPAFTQPILYRTIAAHPPPSVTLSTKLIAERTMTAAESDAIQAEYTAALEEALAQARKKQDRQIDDLKRFEGSTAVFQHARFFAPAATAVAPELLDRCARALTAVPAHLKLNPKIKRFLENRARAVQEGGPVDWSFGEALAFGTLMLEGTPVRLSGQDSERGTFSQRHAAIYDIDTRERHVPLQHLGEGQAEFCLYNSSLSEAGVLGFDYGYSLDYPRMLCLWEAQFGDFANGAQTIIDQFIACSESKWQRVSGIVLLLPHGYEGQGPEHSSARLERFLQLCAEGNLQVCNLSTPAQYFHVLRRQMRRDFRKPLVVMAPKSLLRHPAAVSRLDDFTAGRFHEILDDPMFPDDAAPAGAGATSPAERLILCSGKVYYDLVDYRAKNNITDAAIVRVEQLYPLHRDRLSALCDKYDGATLVWCQEESQNMGAWSFILPQLEHVFGHKPFYAGRDPSASPAVGHLARHRLEQTALVRAAFGV